MQPNISIVIIGLNIESTLSQAIESILACDYPKQNLEIIYVDSGSNDHSIGIAKSYPEVKTIELQDNYPTPGKARNSGWKEASHPFLFFMDGDTKLAPQFLNSATSKFKENIGAVTGQRNEKHPRKNLYHLIADIEWKIPKGKVEYFGGDVLISKEALESVGGYDDSLVAGEDPDLSHRLIRQGWKILSISNPMTIHHINMKQFSQYAKRCIRSGHAFAEVSNKHQKSNSSFWSRETRRIYLSTVLPWITIVAFSSWGAPFLGLFLAFAIIFRSARHFAWYQQYHQLTVIETLLYITHLAIAPYLQLIGVLRFRLSKWKLISPLRNHSPRFSHLSNS